MPYSQHGRCTWNQTADELEVQVPLGSGDVKSRNISFKLSKRVVTLGLSEQEYLKDVELCHPIDPEESNWQLERSADGKTTAVLSLKKERSGVSWRALLLADDPKPPKDAPDTAFNSWTTGQNKHNPLDPGAKNSETTPPPTSIRSIFSTMEPGTLTACIMLCVSICVGLFKSYMVSVKY
eukprot:TRINITY_DN22491_c0_g1_i1.p1 TRINITY_DN22491_c0_g1~~TRINITY_DN22491_c0_g1_i1.p1  ORF type:complete len:197 (+),score=21.13 TRINITY_DN22491_c0_g1_i1:53-592(+)